MHGIDVGQSFNRRFESARTSILPSMFLRPRIDSGLTVVSTCGLCMVTMNLNSSVNPPPKLDRTYQLHQL